MLQKIVCRVYGNPAEDGTVSLEGRIPKATADEGYGNGTWDVDPATATEIKDGAEFTITFVMNAQEPDPTPDTPAPDPVVPGLTDEPGDDEVTIDDEPAPLAAPAPAPAAPVADAPVDDVDEVEDAEIIIDEEDVPLAASEDDADDGDAAVTIEDEETPLAASEDVACCILHLLILLAALDLIALSRALCNAFRKKIPLPALCAERGRGITLNTLRSR